MSDKYVRVQECNSHDSQLHFQFESCDSCGVPRLKFQKQILSKSSIESLEKFQCVL